MLSCIAFVRNDRWAEWMIVLGPMGTIYRVHEGNPRLHYYNNVLDYYTLNTPPQMQHECNDVAFEEFTKHTQLKRKLIHLKSKIKCHRSLQLSNIDEDLHKRVLPSWIILGQIP
jgi:hypothetical protein